MGCWSGQVDVDHLDEAAGHGRVVGQRSRDGGAGRVAGAQPLGDQLARRDEHSRRSHLAQPAGLQPPDRLAEPNQFCGAFVSDARLVDEDLLLHIRCGETEVDGDHALARRVLEVLENALIAGVVGHHEAEAGCRVQRLAQPLDRQLASVVGQWVQHHRGVLTRLHHLVEVTDRAVAHRTGQRAVDPFRVAAAKQEASDEIGGGQVVMAGNGDERPVQVVRHRLDEAGLATPGGALEGDGQPLPVGGLEHLLLVGHWHVVRARRLHRHRFLSEGSASDAP